MDFEFKNTVEVKKKSDVKKYIYFSIIAVVLLGLAFGFTFYKNYKKSDYKDPAVDTTGKDESKKDDIKKIDDKTTMQDIKEFKKVTTVQGSGEGVKAGQTVSANYTGKLLDGTVFDSSVLPSFGHVKPFEFTVGQGQVIKGWDQGFLGMKKGEKATLYIPSEMAYGERGAGALIKPNSDLIFEVEVLEIK